MQDANTCEALDKQIAKIQTKIHALKRDLEPMVRNRNERMLARHVALQVQYRQRLAQKTTPVNCLIPGTRQEITSDKEAYLGISELLDIQQRIPVFSQKMKHHHESRSAVQVSLKQRRKQLIRRTSTLFCLIDQPGKDNDLMPTGMTRIFNLHIPLSANYNCLPVEQLNAVMGHMIHLIKLLCFYLNVKAPFQMNYLSSRSSLQSRSHDQSVYPLYTKENVPNDNFIVALAMMNYNIACLCQSQGKIILEDALPFAIQNILNLLHDIEYVVSLDDYIITSRRRTNHQLPMDETYVPPRLPYDFSAALKTTYRHWKASEQDSKTATTLKDDRDDASEWEIIGNTS